MLAEVALSVAVGCNNGFIDENDQEAKSSDRNHR